MVLRGGKRAKHSICQRRSRWLPALLDGIEFRSICWEPLETERPAVSTTELTNKSSLVRGAVVDEQQDATPSSQGGLEESNEFSLSFAFVERVHEPSLGSCSENVCADILVIDEHRRVAAASCPAARDDGNQAESCFVLSSDDESALLVDAHQSSRFFLNAAIVAASARW